jgi:hypothetical protein
MSRAESDLGAPDSGFRAIVNRSTGERIQFMQAEGDVVRFAWRSEPGGEITEHLHPSQEERFMIHAGEAHFLVDGVEHVVGAGETIVVPIGARHSECNRGSVSIEGVVELRPALATRQMHEAFAGLASEGKTDARGAPKNPLQLGATVWRFRRESRVTTPPVWLQDVVLPPLALLARVCGVSAYRDRWDSRTVPTAELTIEEQQQADGR